jgi:hypothetical protein
LYLFTYLIITKDAKASDGQEKRKTFKVPRSSAVASVMDFLPKLKASNEELVEKISRGEAADIEAVEPDEA